MGSAQCVGYAPGTFGQDDDTVAFVINQNGDPDEHIEAAVKFCPTQSISIVEVP
jgi:ferredoxin